MFVRSMACTAGLVAALCALPAHGIDILPPAEVDVTGVWSAEGAASFKEPDKGEIDCRYEGSLEFLQTGSALSGQSMIGLVTGDASCPDLFGPVSGTVSENTVDFLIGGPVKSTGVEFCGDVRGDVMSGDWVAPPPLPCFILKQAKGAQLIGTFSGERVPPGAPALGAPGLAVMILLLAGTGLLYFRRRLT